MHGQAMGCSVRHDDSLAPFFGKEAGASIDGNVIDVAAQP